MKKLCLWFALMVCCFAVSQAQPTGVTLTSPNGPAVLRAGTTVPLTWTVTGWGSQSPKRALWRLQYATSSQGPWTDIVTRSGAPLVISDTNTNASSLVSFRVPGVPTTSGFVRIVNANTADSSLNLNVADANDSPFTIDRPEGTKVDSILRGNISGMVTLRASKIYGIDGYVFVDDGATLAIQPGTVIVGDTVGQNSAICVNRGGKIMAKGTKELPIVFTSSAEPGRRAAGDWGGILICGRASTNQPGNNTALEGGIADANGVRGWYGGNDDNDNSGTLQYVRIEFAGIAAFPNEELNALTLGGVGRGTTIDHVQCSFNGDDAYEWFGGTVNAKHLITYRTLDDDFDTDNGFRGKVQYAFVQRWRDVADQSTSQAFESDNNAAGTGATPLTQPVFSNVTVIGPVRDTSWTAGNGANQYSSRYGAAIQIRRNSRLSLFNSVLMGWPSAVDIPGANTAAAAMADSLQLKANSFFGIRQQWRANPSSPLNTAWLTTSGFSNVISNNGGDVNTNAALNNPWANDNTLDPRPYSGSLFLTHPTSFFQSNPAVQINDAFFDQVIYRGAFAPGEDRWDLGWAEYDPVNKVYAALPALPTQVELVSPNGGESFTAGKAINIRWTAKWGLDKQSNWRFQFATNPAGPWTDLMNSSGSVVTASVSDTSSSFQLNGIVVLPNTPTQNAYLRVVLLDENGQLSDLVTDVSNNPFTVKSGDASVTLTSPKGGDVVRAGSTATMTWKTSFGVNSKLLWRFQYGTSPTGPWTDILAKNGKPVVVTQADSLENGSQAFRVPAILTSTGYMRIVNANMADSSLNENLFDINDQPFSILQPEANRIDSVLRGTIGSTITLSRKKIYGLDGYVFVDNGAALNIEPGTIILGDTVGQNSAICINRGGQIFARGTKERPIIMTSSAKPGNRGRGDWGGLLICGRARTNQPGNNTALEGGIADAEGVRGWYGGDNDNDNSGVIEYLRIEFAGIAAFPNEELNALTLAAVGSGTTLNHIQCSFNGDDAYEWFGGTVNSKHLIAYGTQDDDFDSDNGFRGMVQFGLVKRFRTLADQSNSEAFESDNNAAGTSATPLTQPVFSNITAIGPMMDTSWTTGSGANQYNNRYLAALQIRRNSRLSLFNSVILGWPAGLEIVGTNTIAATIADSVQVKNNSWYGIKKTWSKDPVGMAKEWIISPVYNNILTNVSGDANSAAMLENPWTEEDVNFNPAPKAEAAFLSNAAFTRTSDAVRIDDNFFEKVSYRGAFSAVITERWDLPWSEYDPVNAVYVPDTADTTTSIVEETASAARIEVYPNPAVTSVKVRYQLPAAGNVTIRMFDAIGNINAVFAESLKQDEGIYEFGITTEGLTSGVYYLQISNSHGTTTVPVNVVK